MESGYHMKLQLYEHLELHPNEKKKNYTAE